MSLSTHDYVNEAKQEIAAHHKYVHDLEAQVEALQRERDDLHNQLIEVTDHRCTLVKENERLKAPVSDEKLHAEVCKILGRAETSGESFGVTAGRLINFIASRATQPAPQEPK